MSKTFVFYGIIIVLLLLFGTISCFPPYENHIKNAIEAVSDDDYDKAIAELTEAIEIEPDRATGYFWRGACFYEIEKYDLAIDDFTKAIMLEDDNLNSEYNQRGLAYSAIGDYDSAISDFTKAIQIYPNPLYYDNRGLAYYGKGDYDLSIKDYTEAIRLSPQDERLYSNRADAYIATGQTSLAIADLRKTVELSLAHDYPEILQSARERLKSLAIIE